MKKVYATIMYRYGSVFNYEKHKDEMKSIGYMLEWAELDTDEKGIANIKALYSTTFDEE